MHEVNNKVLCLKGLDIVDLKRSSQIRHQQCHSTTCGVDQCFTKPEKMKGH